MSGYVSFCCDVFFGVVLSAVSIGGAGFGCTSCLSKSAISSLTCWVTSLEGGRSVLGALAGVATMTSCLALRRAADFAFLFLLPTTFQLPSPIVGKGAVGTEVFAGTFDISGTFVGSWLAGPLLHEVAI